MRRNALLVLLYLFGLPALVSAESGYTPEPWSCSMPNCSAESCTSKTRERPQFIGDILVTNVRGIDVVQMIDQTPGASVLATYACNGMENDEAWDADDLYKICGKQPQVLPPDPPAPPTVEPQVPEQEPKLLKTVKLKRGQYPRLFVDGARAIDGADLDATYACNNWDPDTNPKLGVGANIKICGWNDPD